MQVYEMYTAVLMLVQVMDSMLPMQEDEETTTSIMSGMCMLMVISRRMVPSDGMTSTANMLISTYVLHSP